MCNYHNVGRGINSLHYSVLLCALKIGARNGRRTWQCNCELPVVHQKTIFSSDVLDYMASGLRQCTDHIQNALSL